MSVDSNYVISGVGNVLTTSTIPTNTTRVIYADKTFSGTTKDATAHLQGLFDAASAAYDPNLGRVRVVIGSGIWMVDGLVWRSNVWYDWGDAVIRKRQYSVAPYNRIIGTVWPRVQTNGSYYGQADNIKSTGGRFETNSVGTTANWNGIFVVDEARDSEFSDFTVVHSPGIAHWAAQFSGQRIRITNPCVLNGSELFQDGLHLKYGRDISVIGGNIVSGDDAIALGWDISAASQAYDDEALEDVTIVGTTVNSNYGSGVKVYYGIDTPGLGGTNRRKVRRASILGITGYAGKNRNGGIAIIDGTATYGTRDNVQDIEVQASLSVGGGSHDGVNAYGVFVATGTRIKITTDLNITDTTGGVTRFRPLFIRNGDGVSVSLRTQSSVELSGLISPDLTNTFIDNISINDFDFYSANVAGNYGLVIAASSPQTIGTVSLINGIIRGVQNTSYGVFASGFANGIDSITLNNVTIQKIAGATSARAYAINASGNLINFSAINCDFSDLLAFSVAAFETNHPNYCLSGNRGILNKYKKAATVVASGATPTLDCPSGPLFTMTIGTNATWAAPTNVPAAGNPIYVLITQDATGGRTVSWDAAYIFPTAWTNTGNTAGKKSLASFISDGTNLIAQGANAWY